jgi:hypothetical protein
MSGYWYCFVRATLAFTAVKVGSAGKIREGCEGHQSGNRESQY